MDNWDTSNLFKKNRIKIFHIECENIPIFFQTTINVTPFYGNANFRDLTTNNPFDLEFIRPYDPLELSAIFGLMTLLA